MSSAKAGTRPNSSKWLDVKAFAATALVFDIGVIELEAFVQTLSRKVELGTVQVRQALRVHHHLDAVALELQVVRRDRVGIFELVRHPGAARGAYAQAQRHALASLGEEVLDVRCSLLGKRNGHV